MPNVYAPISIPDDFTPSLYGLFSVVNWLTNVDQHWKGGVQYDSDCAKSSITTSPCVSGSPDFSVLTKSATFSHVVRGSRPFTVYTEHDCSAPGGGWENIQDRVLRAHSHSAPTLAETAFWNGQTVKGAPVFPNLSTTGPIFDETNRILLQPASQPLITGTAVVGLDIVEALQRLEFQFAQCYDGVGVVHVPTILLAALAARNLCYEKNGALYTYRGNRVAVGDGYTGGGPDGAAAPAGAAWMRMTSPVFGIRGAVETLGDETAMFFRDTNTVKIIAEQTFLFGWECCLLGVLATTGGELAGLPNTAQAQS